MLKILLLLGDLLNMNTEILKKAIGFIYLIIHLVAIYYCTLIYWASLLGSGETVMNDTIQDPTSYYFYYSGKEIHI